MGCLRPQFNPYLEFTFIIESLACSPIAPLVFVAQKHFNFADPTNQLTRALDSGDAPQFQKILVDSLMQLALRPTFLLQYNDGGFQ